MICNIYMFDKYHEFHVSSNSCQQSMVRHYHPVDFVFKFSNFLTLKIQEIIYLACINPTASSAQHIFIDCTWCVFGHPGALVVRNHRHFHLHQNRGLRICALNLLSPANCPSLCGRWVLVYMVRFGKIHETMK